MKPPTMRQKRAQNEIRQIRREMRLSMRAFAKLMGVHRDTICGWENGRKNPLARTTLFYIWWRGPIKAARIAERIIQAAFSD